MICKLFGHRWYHYEENVKEQFPNNFSGLSGYYYSDIETEFRFCTRCHKNQIKRIHWPGYIIEEWRDYRLNKEQSRDKKLKDLGI